MSEQRSREIRLASRPVGLPNASHFELATVPVRAPGDGEIVVRNEWMSVDPYMRGMMIDQKSYARPFQVGEVMDGRAVGRVVASRSPQFAEGDYVFHMHGWRDYAVAPAEGFEKVDPALAPVEAFLGALGAPGLTAYVGLMRIAELKDGDAVFVSAAAGAVGSVACQLAKARGCYVVGSAGSDDKCSWLLDEAGIDAALNYRTCGDLTEAVGHAFPKGIDVNFENVGGPHLVAALNHMNTFGRIALCGMIAQYNDVTPSPGPSNLSLAIMRSLKLQGFVVRNHLDLKPQFMAEAGALIKAGKLKRRETVEEGLENAPRAFLKLFSGENFGKMLVHIA
ncbi:NADP-dependent oxidoreductase [Chelatococcus reniformis]|uniref:NADP-dependent oxidoreductase n=1 Tax=Chelatococcus reniformis TaxID=1494448 RepID=A0A916X7R7_9HYPH|nr:NADP-dependent oxidoreductase [Chelatococcus reniformis]GGC47046.1 NADP-dependent oxidoreductase [Chelatococcus reniformis]